MCICTQNRAKTCDKNLPRCPDVCPRTRRGGTRKVCLAALWREVQNGGIHRHPIGGRVAIL